MILARRIVCLGLAACALTLRAAGISAQDLVKADTQAFPWADEKWPFPMTNGASVKHLAVRPSAVAARSIFIFGQRSDFADARPAYPMTTKSSASATSN